MKFIFKKYLDFEKLYGNEKFVENVKQMAAKYVENKQEVFKMAYLQQHDQTNGFDGNNGVDIINENNNNHDLEKTILKNLKI